MAQVLNGHSQPTHNRHPAHLKYPKANQRPSLINNFLDVQIIKMHVSGSAENFKYFFALVLKLLMKNISNLLVRLFVISLLTFRFFRYCISFRSRSRHDFYGSGSGSGSEQTVSAAPAPAPTKMCRLRRLRLRLRLRLRIPGFNRYENITRPPQCRNIGSTAGAGGFTAGAAAPALNMLEEALKNAVQVRSTYWISNRL